MTADRPYRKALPERAAITELCHCAGRQFDLMVVAAFCSVVQEPDAIDSTSAGQKRSRTRSRLPNAASRGAGPEHCRD
jgi:HD-GYP domain-containing protein (c-di-GMP phosphodiesterase class II)